MAEKKGSRDKTLYCSFCGKSQHEVKKLIAGPSVFICDECIDLCNGMAASMGAFLLAAGAKGKRFALPNSRVMIHQPLGGAQGQATDIEIHAREILRLRADLNRILSERTGQPLEKIERDTERDYFMSATEAAQYGLVDKVIDKRA